MRTFQVLIRRTSRVSTTVKERKRAGAAACVSLVVLWGGLNQARVLRLRSPTRRNPRARKSRAASLRMTGLGRPDFRLRRIGGVLGGGGGQGFGPGRSGLAG